MDLTTDNNAGGCTSWIAVVVLISAVVWPLILTYNEGLRRRVEGAIGGFLLKLGSDQLIRSAGLIKKVELVNGVPMHYYERPGTGPVLLLLHGMTSESKNLATLASDLAKGLPEWRLILPDACGHGCDLKRVRKMGIQDFPYPKADEMGFAIRDLIEQLGVTKTYIYGASLGGAMAYFMQHHSPHLVKKICIIAPAFDQVLEDKFLEDWKTGRKNHFCWESRQDVEKFMIDLSCPQRKKLNPIPTFMLEAIWQDRRARAPEGHFRKLVQKFVDNIGKDPDWLSCKEDLAPDLPRLVLWPEEDFVCNLDKGKAFFQNSSSNTVFKSIPNCGHLFHSDGQTVLVKAAPLFIDYLKNEQK